MIPKITVLSKRSKTKEYTVSLFYKISGNATNLQWPKAYRGGLELREGDTAELGESALRSDSCGDDTRAHLSIAHFKW